MQHSNTASSLSPQFSTFTEHNLLLTFNNMTDVSDIFQNSCQNVLVDVSQLAIGTPFNLPNEVSDTHGIQQPREKIASHHSNAGSTVACDNCSSVGAPGILNGHVTGECEHFGSVAVGDELYDGLVGGGNTSEGHFTSLPCYSNTGDILSFGSSYDQELPTPQLTPDQSSIGTSQAGLTCIAVTTANYSSSMTNASPIVTGYTGQLCSKEGGELVMTSSSSLDSKLGPNHVTKQVDEDIDEVWDLHYGFETDVHLDEYLNCPKTVQNQDQNRLHQQETTATIAGISANVTHLFDNDLEPLSCNEHDIETGRTSIGGSHGNTSSDSTSTFPQLPFTHAQQASSQTRLNDTAGSSIGGNTLHSTEKHHPEPRGGEHFYNDQVGAQPGQDLGEPLNQPHSKLSHVIEDSFEIMKLMTKGSQSVQSRNIQCHSPAAFCDSRRDEDAPFDLASITPLKDASTQTEAIDNTVTPNICSPVMLSLVTTSNATVDITRDAADHSQLSAFQPSMETQGLCEKTELFQTQTYWLKEEQITDITVRRDISGFQLCSACEIMQCMSESYQKCKECLNQRQMLKDLAITTSARLCKTDFDLKRMRMRIHLPIQCIGLVKWLQQDPPMGMLSLWGSFTVHVDGHQAYVKIEILKILNRMQVKQYNPCVDDVLTLQLLLKMAIQPVLCSPHARLSPNFHSQYQTINRMMSDPFSCASRVADLGQYFREYRFCQLQVKVEGEAAISVFCLEKESLSEAVKNIQSMLRPVECRTWRLYFEVRDSCVKEEVAHADCPMICLKFVLIPDKNVRP